MLGIIAIVTLLICAQALPSDVDRTERQSAPQRYDTEKRIEEDGYYSESHDVVTEDGYVLEINRIPNGRIGSGANTAGPKPVVFLMHGLQSCALSFIIAGPSISLAYYIADAGYDVWLGNGRGSVNSRRHVSLNPDDSKDKREFFDYTFEDVATKDLPTMIDYVLKVTNQEQLNYIGHSQGGTVFLVLNSLKPEYNKKFKSAHLLAGVGYQQYFPNKVLSLAAISTDIIYAFAVVTGGVELFGPSADNDEFKCREDDKNSIACILESITNTMESIDGPFEVIAGAAVKQYAHYGQNIRDKKFRRWYYNPVTNLLKYGSLFPPNYDLSSITADVTLHYGNGDILLHERDILSMAEVIPNAKVRKVARETFSHNDFISADDSRELVIDFIIEKLNEKNK